MNLMAADHSMSLRMFRYAGELVNAAHPSRQIGDCFKYSMQPSPAISLLSSEVFSQFLYRAIMYTSEKVAL
jgi:hypothetical protein